MASDSSVPVNGTKSFPPKPANLDWAALSPTNQPTVNGHVECRFLASKNSWTTPELVKDPYLRVHGLAPGLNFGQQVYEGLKAFRTPQNTIHIFRPGAHAERLRHSAKMVCLPEVPDGLFYECVRLAVASNAEFVPPGDTQGFLYIRPLLFGSGPMLALAPPDEFILAVYIAPMGPYHGDLPLDAVVLENFDRAAPRGTGSGKLGGNYAPVWPHALKAKQSGFPMTLHLDCETRSFIEEFSTSGFLGVAQDKTIYVPDSSCAISSITSDSLTTIAERAGWVVRREKIPYSTIGRFSEVFAVGTAVNAVPIRSITRKYTREKTQFETTSSTSGLELVKKLSSIQRGLATDELGWCWTVQVTGDY